MSDLELDTLMYTTKMTIASVWLPNTTVTLFILKHFT